MTHPSPAHATLHALDDSTRWLVRLSAVVAAGSESEQRESIADVMNVVPAIWVEELLLQTYLFAGFPRALNATREWRRVHPTVESKAADAGDVASWRATGEVTCATVYGAVYDRLRVNIRQLHPSLDEWMITEGYGKVLSRPGLDLARRELCIVAACLASGQDRQLHSHLHGARNSGASDDVVTGSLDALNDLVPMPARMTTGRMLWARIQGK